MTSLFDLDQNSSDSEDDVDYVPKEEELSEVSDDVESAESDDEKHEAKTSRKRKARTLNKRAKSHDVLDEKVSPVDEKKKANEVWKSFLEEVAEVNQTESTTVAGISSPQSSTTSTSPVSCCTEKYVPLVNTSEKVLDKTCEKSEDVIADGKDNYMETKITTSSVKDNQIEENKPVVPNVKRKGLDSVLGSLLNKKQKINTLQKSLMDWKSFKKDEGIEDDLANFNRGKGGFIERQRFLERSDLRSYEQERDLRLTKRKKT